MQGILILPRNYSTDRCSFGDVVQGMEVLDQIAQSGNVEDVHISDSGAVIAFETQGNDQESKEK